MIKLILPWFTKTIRCDGCGIIFHNEASTKKGVRNHATKNYGWINVNDRDYCEKEECKQEANKYITLLRIDKVWNNYDWWAE